MGQKGSAHPNADHPCPASSARSERPRANFNVSCQQPAEPCTSGCNYHPDCAREVDYLAFHILPDWASSRTKAPLRLSQERSASEAGLSPQTGHRGRIRAGPRRPRNGGKPRNRRYQARPLRRAVPDLRRLWWPGFPSLTTTTSFSRGSTNRGNPTDLEGRRAFMGSLETPTASKYRLDRPDRTLSRNGRQWRLPWTLAWHAG